MWNLPITSRALQDHSVRSTVSVKPKMARLFYGAARGCLPTMDFLRMDRELVAGEAHGLGNYVQRPELRLRNRCEH
jgi:hypothetical protein